MASLVSRYGAVAVFLLMVPESACIPVPSEVTLIAAGVAVRQGWLSPWLAILAATAGNVVGSLLAYGLGASGLLGRVPALKRALERFAQPVSRSGLRAVFLARLTPLARTFISLPAGAARLPLLPFTLLTAAGCGIWAAAFIGVGVAAGSAWQVVSSWVGKGLLAAGLLFCLWLFSRHRSGAGGGRSRNTSCGDQPPPAAQTAPECSNLCR